MASSSFQRVSDTLVLEGDRSQLSRDIIQKIAQEHDAIERIEYSNQEYFQKEKINKDKFFNELRIIAEADAELLRNIWLEILKNAAEKESTEDSKKEDIQNIDTQKSTREDEQKKSEEEKKPDPLEALLNERNALNKELSAKQNELDTLWKDAVTKVDSQITTILNAKLNETKQSLNEEMKLKPEELKDQSPEKIKELESQLASYISNKFDNDLKDLNDKMPSLLARTTTPDMISKQPGAYDAVYQAAYSKVVEGSLPDKENKEETKTAIPEAPELTNAARAAASKEVNKVAVARQDLMAEIRAVGAAREKFGEQFKGRKNVAMKCALAYGKKAPIKEYGELLNQDKRIGAKSEEIIGVQYQLKQNAEKIAVLMDSKKPKLQNEQRVDAKNVMENKTNQDTQSQVQNADKSSNEPSLWSRIRNAVKDLAETIKSIGKKEPEKEAKATGPSKTMGH